MDVSLIAAVDENFGIGYQNHLPWHLPKEYALFKRITQYHHILMGSRTFESLGKPLPKRTHIVISRRRDYPLPEGCFLVSSLEEGLQIARERAEKEAFVIGGSQIYSLALPYADWLYISFIHAAFEVDAYFPQLNWGEWVLKEEQYYPSDEKNAYSFTFRKYRRKTS